MYCRLKDKKHVERSLNRIIISSRNWTVISKKQEMILKPFHHILDFCVDPKEELKKSLAEETNSEIDLSTYTKAQLINLLSTNKVIGKTKVQLKKFTKSSLIKLAKGEL